MFTAVVAIGLFVSGQPVQQKADKDENPLSAAAKQELEKLQGKWRVVKLAGKGMEQILTPNDPELIGEFKGRKWIFTGVDKGEIVALDPEKKPKCIDIKRLEAGRPDTIDEAIYKIEGDTLTICLYQGKGKNRPADFDIPKVNDIVLAEFQRVPARAKK
jgi:uncharacterized protein (TIGR03067 family)